MADATIRDVARIAQCSVASVSRALNGHKSVRPETRARIVSVAGELGYIPHSGARSLSVSRSNAIGVVLPDLHGEFFSEIVRGMDREATRLGLQLLLSNMHADADQAGHALRTMHGRVDGVVIMSPQLDAIKWQGMLPRTLPAILLNSWAPPERPSIAIDNRAGAVAITRHLIEIGRRTIVHISGPESNIDARERRDGFEQAIAQYGGGVSALTLPGDFEVSGGERAAEQILSTGPRPDAIFAANDMMAVGCLQVFRAAGIRTPHDIAVAGFDDVPLARYLDLTTARVQIADMGARAVLRLADIMKGRDSGPTVELLRPELVVRGTTASA